MMNTSEVSSMSAEDRLKVNDELHILKGPGILILTDFNFRSPLWYIPPTKYFHTVNTGIYPVPQ